MIISPTPIIYGLIFVAVLLLVEGIYLVAFGKSISPQQPRQPPP